MLKDKEISTSGQELTGLFNMGEAEPQAVRCCFPASTHPLAERTTDEQDQNLDTGRSRARFS